MGAATAEGARPPVRFSDAYARRLERSGGVTQDVLDRIAAERAADLDSLAASPEGGR